MIHGADFNALAQIAARAYHAGSIGHPSLETVKRYVKP